jgi:hypothetical protein
MHQPTISLTFIFNLYFSFVRRSFDALRFMYLCSCDFGKCGLNHTIISMVNPYPSLIVLVIAFYFSLLELF